MKNIILIEVIFKGLLSTVDNGFLRELISNSKEVRFNSPEIMNVKDFTQVQNIIEDNEYADLVINLNSFNFGIKEVLKVFANFCRSDDQIEFFLFFNPMDLDEGSLKLNIDYLKKWSEDFQRKYNFSYFICQIDNAEDNEYYFDNKGLGRLYYTL